MFKKFMIASVAALTLLAANAMAEGSNRVRLMLNPSVSYSGDRYSDITGADTSADTDVSGGYGLQYVSADGWGVGYTVSDVTTTDKASVSRTVLGTTITTETTFGAYDSTQFLDATYTFGEDLTAQLVLGYAIGGTLVAVSDATFDDLSLDSGTAFGVVGGYDLGGFELLLGYRSETITYSVDGTEWDRSRGITQFGLGYTW
jgi:hypothetical protein